jgi:hypothetical protein
MYKSNHSLESLRPIFGLALRTVASMAILSTGFGIASAQAAPQTAAQTGNSQSVAAQPLLNLQVPALDSSTSLFSSSSDAATDTTTTTEASVNPVVGANFANMMQYGGGQRRRYGAPRYRGSNTNQDGSPKYTFFGGVGLVQPVGNTWHYYTPSYGFQVGGGRQFNNKLALTLDFDFDHLGLTGQTIGNQLTLYNNDINYYCSLNPAYCNANGVTDYSSLDGNGHVWSFTLDPTYTFFQGKTVGAYAVAGVGYYHKVTNFTTPATGVGYDPYYGYYEYTANQVIDHYTSNAPGFSGGFGVTYKFSRFSNERFYAEARYVFVDNSYRPGVTVNSPVATTYQLSNDFPANSNHTTYFPIKVGLRF